MKKILCVIAFVFIGFSGFAQEANTAFKAKTIQLIEYTSGAQFDVILQPITNMIPEHNQAAFKAEVKESLKGLYSQLADLYMQSFTEEDIDGILAFYNSPIGKKLLAETPAITEKSMQIGQAWGMQLQPIVAKYQQ